MGMQSVGHRFSGHKAVENRQFCFIVADVLVVAALLTPIKCMYHHLSDFLVEPFAILHDKMPPRKCVQDLIFAFGFFFVLS